VLERLAEAVTRQRARRSQPAGAVKSS